MKIDNPIILCQPDENKGCSACCGLFNLQNISKNNLTKFLHDKNKAFDDIKFRDSKTHICPYQGFLTGSCKPGCLLHPEHNDKDDRDLSFFGKKICQEYLCPAHIILKQKQKQLLLKCTDDWYIYSIAIIDPEFFIWILKTIQKKIKMNIYDMSIQNDDFFLLICKCLNIHAEYLYAIERPIYMYSFSEYNLDKQIFPLSSKDNQRSDEKNKIKILIENF